MALPENVKGTPVRTKRGSRWRIPKLVREDATKPVVRQCSVLGQAWETCKDNQTKPVVVNALLATHRCKRFLTEQLGADSTSLGTTGVERSWWRHHLENLNAAGVWLDNAGLQFRAVCAWKKEVRACLRGLVSSFSRRTGPSREMAELSELLESLNWVSGQGRRQSVLEIGDTPEAVPNDAINLGLDEFRRHSGSFL